MTHDDLQAWQARMGLSQRGAAEALGVSLSTYQAWARGHDVRTGRAVTIDRRTALACAAIESGLLPTGDS